MSEARIRGYINEATGKLDRGSSVDFITNWLKGLSVSKSKTKRVIEEALNNINYKYSYSIKQHLLNGTLDDNFDKFKHLNKDVYNQIKDKQLDYINYDIDVIILSLVIAKTKDEKIVEAVGTSFRTKKEIFESIDAERKKIVKKAKGERMGYFVAGLIGVVLGIVILFVLEGRTKGRLLPLILGIGALGKGITIDPHSIYKNLK
ncbi:MAG: hypothetical protein HKN51_03730 [Saprospiraceae bacterium]|nr:hypothetical protein [Saprospiraceae bacterium]